MEMKFYMTKFDKIFSKSTDKNVEKVIVYIDYVNDDKLYMAYSDEELENAMSREELEPLLFNDKVLFFDVDSGLYYTLVSFESTESTFYAWGVDVSYSVDSYSFAGVMIYTKEHFE